MKNKKINELTGTPITQPSEKEQIDILSEFNNEQKNRIEILRKMLENLKQEFGE